MTNTDLLDVMGEIDFDLVEDAENVAKIGVARRRKNRMRWGALAACLLLIVGVTLYKNRRWFISIPTYENAAYSAAEIAEMVGMNEMLDGGTRSYVKIYVPDASRLSINPIPEEEYLPLYRNVLTEKKYSKAGVRAFAAGLYGDICRALDIPKEKLVEYSHEYSDGSGFFELWAESDTKYSIDFTEDETLQTVQIRNRNGITFCGEDISIDQTADDREIIVSLEPLRKNLCEVFGVDFPDTRIVRKYGDDSEHGAEFISVYFYGADAFPWGSQVCGDYIELRFDNFEHYAGAPVSDKILSNVSVIYRHYRGETFRQIANVRRLSLEEAEKMLYKGYVFGGHVCPLCMAAQAEVDFHGYDFVSLDYLNGVPFYAFYKKIDLKTKNGNLVYAQTYVPAFEVSGLKEYFESQKKNHSSAFIDEVMD